MQSRPRWGCRSECSSDSSLDHVRVPADRGAARLLSYPPRASWVLQQLREAFPGDTSIRYPIHDNDSIFSHRVDQLISSIGIEPGRTAFRSRWQNGLAEQWVGTLKRDLLDHVVVVDEQHLLRLLREYVEDDNTERVHTVLQDAPARRPVDARPSPSARIAAQSRLGGPHHRYEWKITA